MKSIIAAFVLPLFIVTMAVLSHSSGAGIIALDGYAHAVVLCGEGLKVNFGHEADPEIPELLALAAEMCPAQ